VLLSGPPGLGKTTLARIIAQEMASAFQGTSAPALKRPGDLVGLLTGLPEHSVLFIDEIHRLPAAFEEYLYSAMEDFFIDVPVDQGPAARSIRFNLKALHADRRHDARRVAQPAVFRIASAFRKNSRSIRPRS